MNNTTRSDSTKYSMVRIAMDGKHDYDNIIIFVFFLLQEKRYRRNKVDDKLHTIL